MNQCAPALRWALGVSLAAMCSVLACSQTPTTAAGALGEVDLRPQLPAGVTAPPNAELEAHEGTRTFCGVADWPPAEAKIAWKTFRHGDDAYVASVSVALTHPAEALVVEVGEVTLVNADLTAGGPYQGMANIEIACRRKTLRVDQHDGALVQVKADGTMPGSHVVTVR